MKLPLTLATLAAAALTGCASTSVATAPQDVVAGRSAQWFAARTSGDVPTAYGFLPPAQRAVQSREQFEGKYGRKSAMLDGKVYSVLCEAERCVLSRQVSYVMPMLGNSPLITYLDETWMQEGEQWWVLMD